MIGGFEQGLRKRGLICIRGVKWGVYLNVWVEVGGIVYFIFLIKAIEGVSRVDLLFTTGTFQ